MDQLLVVGVVVLSFGVLLILASALPRNRKVVNNSGVINTGRVGRDIINERQIRGAAESSKRKHWPVWVARLGTVVSIIGGLIVIYDRFNGPPTL